MGVALQAALAAIEAHGTPADEMQLVAIAKARALMVGYDARWTPDATDGDRWLPVELERVCVLPLINPSTNAPSRTWRHGGKRDGIVRGFGKTVLLEHKTTSDNILNPNDSYWRRLSIDAQVSHYMLEAWQEGTKLDGTLYDVIKKPGIRPKRLTKAEIAELMGGRYCGVKVSEDAQLDVACGKVLAETAELYAVRLAQDALANPTAYYQRRMVPRLDSDLKEYWHELWSVAEAIRETRVKARHQPDVNPWYRNPGACMQWGRACVFLPLCAGYDAPDSGRWAQRDFVHAELDGIDGDGRDLLTHSRISTWQTCRRKHYWQYELGLDRADEDEGEALFMGTLLHEALLAWWSQQTEGDSST